MGIFSCYIGNVVILVFKNVMIGNDCREELLRWLLGRIKRERKVKFRKYKIGKGENIIICNKIDF